MYSLKLTTKIGKNGSLMWTTDKEARLFYLSILLLSLEGVAVFFQERQTCNQEFNIRPVTHTCQSLHSAGSASWDCFIYRSHQRQHCLWIPASFFSTLSQLVAMCLVCILHNNNININDNNAKVQLQDGHQRGKPFHHHPSLSGKDTPIDPWHHPFYWYPLLPGTSH